MSYSVQSTWKNLISNRFNRYGEWVDGWLVCAHFCGCNRENLLLSTPFCIQLWYLVLSLLFKTMHVTWRFNYRIFSISASIYSVFCLSIFSDLAIFILRIQWEKHLSLQQWILSKWSLLWKFIAGVIYTKPKLYLLNTPIIFGCIGIMKFQFH